MLPGHPYTLAAHAELDAALMAVAILFGLCACAWLCVQAWRAR